MTRTEQANAKDAALDAVIADEEAKESAQVDVFAMAMEVDILSKFTPEWAEGTEKAVKWSEKKDRLCELIAACDTPKLKAGDYKTLVALFTKLLKDSNVVVVGHAVKAFGALGKGLRKDFEAAAKEAIVLLIPKFKDRKLTVDLQNTLDSFTQCVEL